MMTDSVSERTCYEFDKAPKYFERLHLCKTCWKHFNAKIKGNKRLFCGSACKDKYFSRDGMGKRRVAEHRSRAREAMILKATDMIKRGVALDQVKSETGLPDRALSIIRMAVGK